MKTLLAMSGYASYVWGAYGLTIIVLLGLFVYARWRLKKALANTKKNTATKHTDE